MSTGVNCKVEGSNAVLVIEMKDIEFLRNVYRSSGLSIRPKTQITKIDALKEIVRVYGLNSEEVLTKEV